MPLTCPVCRKEMEITYFKELQLDWCRLCGGLWFDGGEVEKLTTYKNIPKKLTHPMAYDYSEKKVQEGERLCPRCQQTMKVVDYQSVKVDVCMKCQGIWFDRYELAKTMGADEGVPKKEFDYKKAREQEMLDAEISSSAPASLSPYSGFTGSGVTNSERPVSADILHLACDLFFSFLRS